MKKWYTFTIPTGGGRKISKQELCEPEEVEERRKDFAEEHLGKAEDVIVDEGK